MNARLALVGVAAGLLSGLLGIGGGIIIVPGLIWAAGLDRHTASGTSLVAILPIAVVAAITYAVAPGGAFEPGGERDLRGREPRRRGARRARQRPRLGARRCGSRWRSSAACSGCGW